MIGSSAVPATTSTETLLGNWSGASDTKLSVQRHSHRQAFVLHLTRGKDVLTCEFTVMWRPKFDPELNHDPYRAWCNGFGMAPGTPATVTFSYYQGNLLGLQVHPVNLYMEFFR